MAETLEGLSVVVTGAAGGIGSALCRGLVAERARVLAVDRDESGLARLGEEVDVQPLAVDLTDAAATMEALGGLDGVDALINNAGGTALGPAMDMPLDVVERVVAVNLFGSVNATRAVLGSLVERRGRIAVLSSVAGFAPLLHRTAYSASKHALHGFFESLRAELARSGVSVTMVCPAFADTGIEDRAVARSGRAAGEWSTTGRHLSPDDVARATVAGLRSRRRLVLPGITAKTAYWAWKLVPVAYERLMRSRISNGLSGPS